MLCFLQQSIQLLCKAIPRGRLTISRSTLRANVSQINFLLENKIVELIVADHCPFLLPLIPLQSVNYAALHFQYLIVLAERQELCLLFLQLVQIHQKLFNRRDGVVLLHLAHLDNDLAKSIVTYFSSGV